jgi:hypothetical protein
MVNFLPTEPRTTQSMIRKSVQRFSEKIMRQN